MVGRPAVTSAAIAAPSKRHDQGQRARPMRFRQGARFGRELADPLRRGQIGHVDDQRVEARPALGRIDPRHGFRIGRIRGEAVDGLGRHRDRLAGKRSAAPLRRLPRR